MRVRLHWTLWLAAGLGGVLFGLTLARWTIRESARSGAGLDGTRPRAVWRAHSDAGLNRGTNAGASARSTNGTGDGLLAIQEGFEPDELMATLASRVASTRDSSNEPDATTKEELGRMALNYVGADPVADEVWVSLINDPNLPANVRQDLIEDLNETGFSEDNGRRATAEDVPLIESRIMLIEEHSPIAMDEVNAAAFAEAYKDLVEMWWRLNE